MSTSLRVVKRLMPNRRLVQVWRLGAPSAFRTGESWLAVELQAEPEDRAIFGRSSRRRSAGLMWGRLRLRLPASRWVG